MTDKTHRDAITGQYVTADHAAANLDTTVSESPCTECERLRAVVHAQKVAIDHYRDQIWDRSDRESLSKALSHGVSFGDLAHTAITNGQRWARTCAALHERSHQPWPPEAPRTPPPA